MEIVLNCEVSEKQLELFEKAASVALKHEEVPDEKVEISISIVDEDTIKNLNNQFRGIDKVTDVLSFPQYADKEDVLFEIEETDYVPIGDVVICSAQAERQATEFGHSIERETIYLFVHSILHLLGYDHMEDGEKAVMRAAEEAIMSEIGLER